MQQKELDYVLERLKELLSIDSPTGFTEKAAEYVREQLEKDSIPVVRTAKGGVLADLRAFAKNPQKGGAVLVSAHIDTLGAMVKSIKPNGRLKVTNVGGLTAANTETENVTVYTRDGRTYGGTLQLCNPSLHVNKEAASQERNWDTVEVVLDENVHSDKDTAALGIENGCYVCVCPRSVITPSGYIKSRFLDDKLSAAILLGAAHELACGRKTAKEAYMHFTVYEEVGHGASGICPEGVEEILGVDMGCVGDGLSCDERKVSICALDSSGPYNYAMTCRLRELAEKHGLGYAVDVYPYYGSDCSAAVRCSDIRHALIGAGVYASHGYERSHTEGVKNTYDLLTAYLCDEA